MTNRDQRGAVTAEAAVVLPVLALVAVALVWMISVGLTEVRAIDAAREVARSAARSDDPAHATELGRQVAPHGSRVTVTSGGGTVTARVESPVVGPARLLGRLASFTVHASAVAVEEPRS